MAYDHGANLVQAVPVGLVHKMVVGQAPECITNQFTQASDIPSWSSLQSYCIHAYKQIETMQHKIDEWHFLLLHPVDGIGCQLKLSQTNDA